MKIIRVILFGIPAGILCSVFLLLYRLAFGKDSVNRLWNSMRDWL